MLEAENAILLFAAARLGRLSFRALGWLLSALVLWADYHGVGLLSEACLNLLIGFGRGEFAYGCLFSRFKVLMNGRYGAFRRITKLCPKTAERRHKKIPPVIGGIFFNGLVMVTIRPVGMAMA